MKRTYQYITFDTSDEFVRWQKNMAAIADIEIFQLSPAGVSTNVIGEKTFFTYGLFVVYDVVKAAPSSRKD